MSKSVIITLTTFGTDTGPFDLYSDVDSYAVPFETGVLKNDLISGYTSNVVPDTANIIRVMSAGECTNYIDLNIIGTTTTTTSTTSTTTIEPLPLRLLYSDIEFSYIADPENVNDWNDAFKLPLYGNPFTSVTVIGNEVFLYGGSNITLTYDPFGDVSSLLELDDQAGCIIALMKQSLEYGNKTLVNLPNCKTGALEAFYGADTIVSLNIPKLEYAGEYMFYNCELIESFNFPELKVIDSNCFGGCISATEFYIPKCIALGLNWLNNNVFLNILGNTITLTVSDIIYSAEEGFADEDIDYLQANNTVTLVVV